MISLTTKQIETLEAINDLETRLGHFPSLRQLCVYLGLNSRLAAYDRLLVLVKKGFIVHSPNQKNKNVFSLSGESRVLTSGSASIACSSRMPEPNTNFHSTSNRPLSLKADSTSGIQDSEMKVGYDNGQYGVSFKNFNSTSIIRIISVVSYLTFASYCFKVGDGSLITPSIFVLINAPLFYGFYKLINQME